MLCGWGWWVCLLRDIRGLFDHCSYNDNILKYSIKVKKGYTKENEVKCLDITQDVYYTVLHCIKLTIIKLQTKNIRKQTWTQVFLK